MKTKIYQLLFTFSVEYSSVEYLNHKKLITLRPLSNWWCTCEQSDTNNLAYSIT